MAHLNPEVVADALIASNTPIEKFKSAVYNDQEFFNELDILVREVREKIAEQRNSEQYAIKFWSEVLEHLEHHKEACTSPHMENNMKKYVQNPKRHNERDMETIRAFKGLVSNCEEFVFYLVNKQDFREASKYFALTATSLSNICFRVKGFDSENVLTQGILTFTNVFSKMVSDLVRLDRFDTATAEDLLSIAEELETIYKENF
jgi:hypothetical protein